MTRPHVIRPLALLPLLAALAGPASSAAAPAAPPPAIAGHGPRPVLPWIANDYTRALAEARARRVPLFIEAWAPW